MNLMVNAQRIEGAQVPTQMIETSKFLMVDVLIFLAACRMPIVGGVPGVQVELTHVYHIKDQSLAAGKVGFVSAESSTPEKHARTFVPVIGTPWCSPHLAAKCK